METGKKVVKGRDRKFSKDRKQTGVEKRGGKFVVASSETKARKIF